MTDPTKIPDDVVKDAREAFARMRGRQAWPEGLTHEQFDKAMRAALAAAGFAELREDAERMNYLEKNDVFSRKDIDAARKGE